MPPREPQDRRPHGLPIRFSNLAILGTAGGSDALVQTLGSTLVDLATGAWLARALGMRRKGTRATLISGVEGVVQQGELLLIIGPPSSDASTLLRAFSCPSDIKLSDSSHLDFGLLPPSRVARPFPLSQSADAGIRAEVVYVNEHDVHFATLSLRSSMMPGSIAKAPHVREDKSTRTEWATRKFLSVVEAMGLGHAIETKVGSPLVRGLSGGERKRASILEGLLTRASVLLLDGPTNGLDSSTALSLLSYLRTWAKDGRRSLVATAPHVADPLFLQFDKVLLLSSTGRQIYFGPTSSAESYFTDLGLGFSRRVALGEGLAEFLVACVEGRGNDVQLGRAWIKSSARQALLREMGAYEATYAYGTCAGPLLAALAEEKTDWTPGSSHYTVSFFTQVGILTRRQYSLLLSELPTYVTKTSVNLCLSVLVGTLFFALPPTTSGAFTRGSLLLLSIMFNAYLSLAELGKTIEGRDIVKRQGDWGFASASALALARVAGDVPLIGAQVLLFGTVTYTLARLQRSLSHFGIYMLFVYATALNLSAMFRMFAAFSPRFDVAIRYCGITLNVLVVYAGYFLPTPTMKPYLKWIRYVLDPISYSYEAVLANEFHNLNLTCSPSDIVPSGPSYTDPRYQTCLLPGSTPRSLVVSGDAYLATAYDFHYDRVWYNLGVIAAQALVFLVVGIVATEFFHFAPQGTKRIWLKMGRKWYEPDELEESQREPLLVDVGPAREWTAPEREEEDPMALVTDGSVLVWRDISLWVDTPHDTRRLLDRISAYVKPGSMLALMGASGAGKSTLLNVLAGRSGGVVRGSILVDGVKPDSAFYRTTGYVEQFDLHDEQSTVREGLEFSALLRQDSKISRADKLAYVDVVLGLLDLADLQDAIVGTPSAGLNPEQRKRLTIAVEVVARPDILFCDEPTTGLDSKSALRVVKLVRRLSRTGIACVVTIHQPSAETFGVFDDLLLLQRGGKQVYFGPRKDAVAFFDPQGTPKDHINPADFLLDAAGAGIDDPDETLVDVEDSGNLALRWKSSPQASSLGTTLTTLVSAGASKARPLTSSASICRQTIELTKRVSRHYYRDASYSYTKLFTATAVSLIIGLSFFNQGNSIVSLQNRLFSVFLILFIPPVFMNLGIFKMFRLRGLWEARERPSKTFGPTAFVTSLIVSELPYSFVCATVYFSGWYFLVGLPLHFETVAYAFTMVQLFFFFQASWAMWITALSKSLGTIANLLPFFLVTMEAFNGALMPYSQMPFYWKWLYWISPFQWYVRGMLGVLLHRLPIVCSPTELVTLEAPPGFTCAGYMEEYLSSHSGYLLSPAALGATCEFCKMSTGDDYLSSINISYDDRWTAMGIFAGYTFTNVVLVYVFTYFPPSLLLAWGRNGGKSRADVVAEEAASAEAAEGIGGASGHLVDAFT